MLHTGMMVVAKATRFLGAGLQISITISKLAARTGTTIVYHSTVCILYGRHRRDAGRPPGAGARARGRARASGCAAAPPPERHGCGRAWSHTRTVPLLYIGGGGEGLARAGPCNGPVGQFWLAREGKAPSPVASSCVRLGPARPSPCAAVLDGVPVNVYDEHGTTSFALC